MLEVIVNLLFSDLLFLYFEFKKKLGRSESYFDVRNGHMKESKVTLGNEHI